MRIATPLSMIAIASCLLIIALPTAQGQDGYDDADRPMLGVVMTPPSGRDLRRNEIEPGEGVVIRRVYDDSAAHHMGLERGDVITQINGVTIDSMTTLRQVIQSYTPGDEVHVNGLRNGQPLTRDGFLGGWPEDIPFGQINAQAEERYRRMVASRMARQAEALDQLRRENDALEQQVAELRAHRDGDNGHGSRAPHGIDQQPSQQRLLSDLLQAGQQGDFAALSALPSWRFHYGSTIGTASDEKASVTKRATTPATWSFSVSTDML